MQPSRGGGPGRPPFFVPENKPINDLMQEFQEKKIHLAVVVDEYGGMEGVVTLEDVVETLLGFEIVDEADKTVDMQALARMLWEKRALRMGLITEKDRRFETEKHSPMPEPEELPSPADHPDPGWRALPYQPGHAGLLRRSC